MKNKQLIGLLAKENPDAEVGYEHLKITYVSGSHDYIDIGGDGFEYETPQSECVFILYVINDNNNEEFYGVYADETRAKVFGEWVLNQNLIGNDEKYINYKIKKQVVIR